MRLLHISDLHFSKISWKFHDLFSKRFLGTANLILKRKKMFLQEKLDTLFPLFDSFKIDTLLITGDLSSTSLDEEFFAAHDFLQKVQKKNMRIFLLPGNHDMYTKEAFEKKSFYQSFANFCDFSSLSKEGISHTALDAKWHLVCLDCAQATSLFSSRGHFSKEVEEKLGLLLTSLRDHFVLLALHFPFSDQISPRKILERKEALRNLLHKHPQVKIFLYGHTHTSSLEDLRYQHLPISIGVGSATKVNHSCCNFLEMTPTTCNVSLLEWDTNRWAIKQEHTFLFTNLK